MTDGLSISLSRGEAENVLESLRKGIPPTGYVRAFTVGREDELAELERSMHSTDGKGTARLIRANYGSGKSHLLRVTREMALSSGYAVSFITMNARGAVRGNRMDQLFAEFCRNMEIPSSHERGLHVLFEAFASATPTGDAADQHKKILVNSWNPAPLQVVGVKRALLQWIHKWGWSRDSSLAHFMRGGFFGKSPRDYLYDQCWGALGDLHRIAELAGFRGLVLLVDEFEDVVQNLNNRTYQQVAFQNMFDFFDGARFPSATYFAVTPEFSQKCRAELHYRGVFDFPVGKFDNLPTFEMSPVTKTDLRRLARIVRDAHGIAYDLELHERVSDAALDQVVDFLSSRSSQDQTRQTIKGIVSALDAAVND